MKTMTPRLKGASLVFLATMATIASGWAEEKPAGKPMLWKVEGDGLEQPSYLFGTLHLGDKALTTLHPAAEKAFKASTVVHTEVAMDAPTQIKSMKLLMRGDDKKLNEVLGQKLAARLNKELEEINPELNSEPFQPMKTWAVAYTLPYLEEQIKGIKPLDMVLWERAEEEGKKTHGMQTTKDQIKGFEALTEDEQTQFMKTALDYMEVNRSDNGRKWKKEAVKVYVSGDADKTFAIASDWMAAMTGGEDTPLFKKLKRSILIDRDVIMVDYVEKNLKAEPNEVHFFAAGAGHYAGKESVPSLLEKKGYSVTRIEN